MKEFNLEMFGAAVGELIRENVAKLQKQIDSLESRLAEVEKSGIKFMGVHQRALQKDYKRGCVVTSAGSAWVAVKDYPEGTPGRSDDWQLMVKAGRDAK